MQRLANGLTQRLSMGVVLVGMLTALMVALPVQSARADFTFYETQPHVGACWDKVNAYGGVYQVTNNLLNGTNSAHTARIRNVRPGDGVQQDSSYTAAAGQWKQGPTAHLSIVFDDIFQYYLDGRKAVEIPARGIPHYMNHCDVEESSSVTVRRAISAGLAQLDAVYNGGCSGAYRYNGQPHPSGTTWNGDCIGQNDYYQPAGTVGFDCSGLITYMYAQAGLDIGAYSSSAMGNFPNRNGAMRPGDLYVNPGSHVAMYVGDTDGDGIPTVLESTPETQNPDGSYTGVIIRETDDYLGWAKKAVPGAY